MRIFDAPVASRGFSVIFGVIAGSPMTGDSGPF
jgi:hypothetical protein